MFKLIFSVSIILNLVFCEHVFGIKPIESAGGRQKKLLFYDEEGNLVKTYTNPYLRDVPQSLDKIPFFGSFFNPFFSFLKPPSTFSSPSTYMVPVSDEIVQQINNDPMYENKLFFLPQRDPIVEHNPSCSGKRTQIPSQKSCNKFVNCWDGWGFEQECPEGLMFSNEGYCDYPMNVDCQNRRLSDEPQQQQQQQCSKEFETFRNELKCSEFFVCVNKSPIKFMCPADLSYNQELGICDYPYRVGCGLSLGVSSDTTSSTAPSSSSTAGTNNPVAADTPVLADTPVQNPTGSPVAPTDGSKPMVLTRNSIFNTQSWTSTHMAMSRQDAIRQLQLGRIANINAAS